MGGSGPSRLLKILHIDPEEDWGGGEAQVFGLLKYLVRRGHCNHLLAHPQGRLWEKLESLELQRFPLIAHNDVALVAAHKIGRLVREQNYDIVHLHTKRAHALASWFAAAQRRAKFVVTRRMDYFEKSRVRARWLYNRRVDGVIAISQTIADRLQQAGVERRQDPLDLQWH